MLSLRFYEKGEEFMPVELQAIGVLFVYALIFYLVIYFAVKHAIIAAHTTIEENKKKFADDVKRYQEKENASKLEEDRVRGQSTPIQSAADERNSSEENNSIHGYHSSEENNNIYERNSSEENNNIYGYHSSEENNNIYGYNSSDEGKSI